VLRLHTNFAVLMLAAGSVGQGEPPKVDVFTCVMHPSVRVDRQQPCPMCGMDLVEDQPRAQRVEIPEGGLRAYCEKYVHEAFEAGRRDFLTMAAYVDLEGRACLPKLRALLEQAPEPDVAYHLGELRDRESIPVLQKWLKDDGLKISEHPYCPEHLEAPVSKSGSCPKCGKPARATVANLRERLSIAEALHRMGDDDGLRALQELVADYAFLAYGALARRDSPEVRAVLAAGVSSDRQQAKAAAIAGQLTLGIDDHVDEALRLLDSEDRLIRGMLIRALGESGLRQAIDALEDIVSDRKRPWEDRVEAAVALVFLGEEQHVAVLLDAFHKMGDGADRWTLYLALGEVGEDKALFQLETAIETDPENRDVAVAAAAKILARQTSDARRR